MIKQKNFHLKFLSTPLDSPSRPVRLVRIATRCVLASLFAGAATLTLLVAWAVHGIGSLHDRVLLGSLILPFLWGAGAIWALTDERLLRPVIGLTAVTAIGAAAVLVTDAPPCQERYRLESSSSSCARRWLGIPSFNPLSTPHWQF